MVWFPPDFPPEWKAQFESEFSRKEKVFQDAADKLAPMIPGMDSKRLKCDLESLHPFSRIPLEDTPEGIESASSAKEALEEVAAAAQLLASRIKHLGPGAIGVMRRDFGPGSKEWQEADLSGLPSDPSGFQSPWCLEMSDEENRASNAAEFGLWLRGGGWVVRLEALAGIAAHGARKIGKHFPKGCGRRTLGQALYGNSRKALVESCAAYLTEHGADLQKTLLLMAGALHEAETSQKPNSTFRKEVSILLKNSPS